MAYIMIEWIDDYLGRDSNLKHSKDNATGFINGMVAPKGIAMFKYSESLAWDTDWEKSGVGYPSGGEAHKYAEKVDMAYFIGHGGPYGPIFARTDHDDGVAHYNDVRLGENHLLKCVVFDADRVLEYSSYWQPAMRGLRHILSFSNNRNDNGERGRYMTYFMGSLRMSIGYSWARACLATDAMNAVPTWLYADYPDQNSSTGSYNEMWQNGFRPSNETTPTVIKLYKF